MIAQLKLVATTSAASLMVIGASPAQANDTFPRELLPKAQQLEPSSNWGLDYAQDGCRLARLFGSDNDQHLLYIEQAWPGDSFTLTMAGAAFKRFRSGGRAYLGLQNDVPMLRFELPPTGNLGQFGPAVIIASVGVNNGRNGVIPRLRVGSETESHDSRRVAAQLDPAEGAKIDRLMIRRSGGKPVSFETGNLKDAFEALNTCTSDLLKDWGLDPAKHASYTPVNWTNQDEVTKKIQRLYPTAALNRGEQAIFRMLVIVDEQGTVTDCQINAATNVDALASPACQEMSDASFSPAIDENGNPMRSFYATTVSYQISN